PTSIEVRSGTRSHRVELLYVHPREMLAGSNGVRGTLEDVARAQTVFDAVAAHLPADWGAARSPAWERLLEERSR
ncbi:MAG: hypothetical protein OEY20_15095, partial [Gemmatimonadota bacterium]|nr:hypothetical protein [Gemmatimonadota bacterium]